MKRIIPFLLSVTVFVNAQTPLTERNLLSKEFAKCNFKEALLPVEKWCPYPRIEKRQFWNAIPEDKKRMYIQTAESELNKDWAFQPAMKYLEFAINGNRSNYESIIWKRQDRLYRTVLAELAENKGRFMNDIVNGAWSFCEESTWCWPACISGLPDVAYPVPDLGAGVKAATLSWISYLLKDKLDSISPQIRQRIRYEVERRLIIPIYSKTDIWWMGYQSKRPNNWNPWITSNYIASVLLLEENIDDQVKYMNKATELLDLFVNAYAEDGGCDEGSIYWTVAGGALFDCLDFLKMATNGKFNIYDESVIKNIGKFPVSMHICNSYFVNFADASASFDFSRNIPLLYDYGKETGNHDMIQLASSYPKPEGGVDFGIRLLRGLYHDVNDPIPTGQKAPNIGFSWFPSVQVMTARDKDGESKGFFLAAQGGHNKESHNHNDVGNFVVYDNGKPFIIDVGVEEYTGKTFSEKRYEIWTMQSQYHNCPKINGVMQAPGYEFKATNVSCTESDTLIRFSLDISKAYPDSAFVKTWQRTIDFHRGKYIELSDNYTLLKSIHPIQWSFMSFNKPNAEKAGIIAFENSDRTLNYNPKLFTAIVETIPIPDPKLKDAWKSDALYRILLTRKSKVKTENCIFIIK